MPDIGATLREARLRAKVDVAEVEEATKIRAKYLRALENEEWGLLPGPAFVKSFLRTYAEYLGLDGKMLVDEYKLSFERPSDLDQMPITPLGRNRSRGGGRPPRPSRISPAWVIGIVIAGLLVLFAVLGAAREDEPDERTTPTTDTLSAAQRRARTARRERRAKRQAARRRAAAARRARVRLRLTPTGPVYVCLQNAGGRKLINGVILSPGNPSRQFTSKRFRMTLGNSSITIRVNGRDVRPPASAGSVGFEVTAKRRRTLPPGRRPVCQ